MNRITLADAVRKFYIHRGLTPEAADAQACQIRSRLVETGKSSPDIHLHDFYFVAFEEQGEFYVDARHLEVALQNLRGLERVDNENP